MVVIFGKTVKPLISNRGINKDDNIFLSYDGEIVNNTNDICRIFNNYVTPKVWMTLSIKMILVNHVYLIMITIEVYARYVT